MLLVWKLEHTVSPAAWPDRQYHLVLNIIKQVIDKKTFRHLRSKEIECAQAGTELSIAAITDTIALYEIGQELTPQKDIPIQFNVNTMQLADQPDIAKTQFQEIQNDIQALTATVKSLQPKRQRTDGKTDKYPDRQKSYGKRRLSQPLERTPSVKRPLEEDKPKPKQENKTSYDMTKSYNPYNKSNYDRYRSNRYDGYNQRSRYDRYEKSSYNDRYGYRSNSSNRYNRYRSSSRNRDRPGTPRPRSVSFNDYKNKRYPSNYNQRYNKNGKRDSKYTLNLYKCTTCEENHSSDNGCENETRHLNGNRRH
jgi:hypothetical protein